ncbi:MAG: Crp/Fnr family transcriptional regulator [Candidatus Bipolaricaulia bacterium]
MTAHLMCAECPSPKGCSWIFSDLDDDEFFGLLHGVQDETYGPGELIFRQGDAAVGLYIVCAGRVKLVKHSVKGKQRILKLLDSGEVLGEESLFGDTYHQADAETLKPTAVKFVRRGDFLSLTCRHPEVGFKLVEKLSRELKGYEAKLTETTYGSGMERVVSVLVRLARAYGIQEADGLVIEIEFTRRELAEMAGVSPETAIRILSRLHRRGLLKLNGGIKVLNPEGLERLSRTPPITLKENVL